MNFDHLKTFLAVADQRSFSEAAKVLYLSQPTITSQVKALERNLETQLFIRTKKNIELTPAAQVLYPYVKEIMDTQIRAKNAIAELLDDVHGKLMIASSLTIGESILPTLLHQFKSEYPRVELRTEIINSQHIVEMVKNEELEIGLIEAELDEPALHIEPFMPDELMLVAKKDFLSCDRGTLSPQELKTLPFVFREEGSGTRTVAYQHLKDRGIGEEDLNVVLELGSTESVKTAIEAGLGVSILSKHAIRKELELGIFEVLPIDNIEMHRSFYIVYKRKRAMNLITERFLELVRNYDDLGKSRFLRENIT